MNIVLTISQILLCILSVVVVVSAMMQEPKDANSQAIFGQSGGGNYTERMKKHTREGKLNTITKYSAIAVAVISFALVVLQRFMA
ncbi:MAG: preprotein translocase subunit SecG [Clostridia bacterium]|nr:preprotein translocase subunit SecG [Clostridia bacterium]